MATFTITIPADKVAAVVGAFATQYNYQATIEGADGVMIPNPVNKQQFAKNIVRTFVREVYTAAQVKGLDTQRQEAINTAVTDTEVITVT